MERERAAGERGPAREFLAAHRSQHLEMSIVTWGELAVGFASSIPLDHFLRRIRVLSLPRQIVWEASRIERELRAIGRPLGENDTWIAATARGWGLPILTQDTAFRNVRRLRVVPY